MIANTHWLPVAALLTMFASPAHAATDDATLSIAVPFTYARIGSEAGRADLRQRVVHAVRLVCPGDNFADLSTANAVARCRTQAMASAEQQMTGQIARAAAATPSAATGMRSAN